MSFWDRRENIKSKPSVEIRTMRVIDHIMEKKGVAIGIAIELLMKEKGLYEQTLQNLSELYPDISEQIS